MRYNNSKSKVCINNRWYFKSEVQKIVQIYRHIIFTHQILYKTEILEITKSTLTSNRIHLDNGTYYTHGSDPHNDIYYNSNICSDIFNECFPSYIRQVRVRSENFKDPFIILDACNIVIKPACDFSSKNFVAKSTIKDSGVISPSFGDGYNPIDHSMSIPKYEYNADTHTIEIKFYNYFKKKLILRKYNKGAKGRMRKAKVKITLVDKREEAEVMSKVLYEEVELESKNDTGFDALISFLVADKVQDNTVRKAIVNGDVLIQKTYTVKPFTVIKKEK